MIKTKTQGFSLIELMVVVSIISILAGISYPAYTSYIAKGKRAEAKAALVAFSGAMERWAIENSSYCNAANATSGASVLNCPTIGDTGKDTGTPLATLFSANVPLSGGTATYTLSISVMAAASSSTTLSTGNPYTLQATRTGSMAGDACGDYTLTNTGTKDNLNLSGGMTAATCW